MSINELTKRRRQTSQERRFRGSAVQAAEVATKPRRSSSLRARDIDVAAGNGNVTLAAAHRWCEVTSTDYVPSLLERGRARASAEGLK